MPFRDWRRSSRKTGPFFEGDKDIAILLKTLWKFLPLGEKIEAFWLDAQNQKTDAWKEHRDINTVMLATSLAPDGFLTIR